ncbi:hypothetical protein [Micromonospora sp. C81]|uniref:hypothetical protein n=1 Tax=Micromonospora TaxID=1873 RepID=UPI001B374EDD|nr:hypothetical protein [Micromonospora sp. C81]MBQ1038670.1 hypothetical protein [Micromonospora sp. C81]WTE87593.1 hypothetical protein OHA01_02415 [Micromonospora zamorensis]
MAKQTNGHASPAELRALAADWRAQADRLESLGGTVMSAYNSIKWSGFAYFSATAAANAVNVKLGKMADAARDFANFLDEYASKVEEQIKREKAATIVQIVLAIFGVLTIGLAFVLAPALAALSSLLASLLPAMNAVAGRIATMLIDVALGFLTFGSMQVAMEFGMRGIVYGAMDLPVELHSWELLLNILLAGGLGGLFSIRAVNSVPRLGSRGATPPPVPKTQASPKVSPATGTDGNTVRLNSPAPVKGADIANTPRVNDTTPAVSASDITAAPVVPAGSHAAPTVSASSAGDVSRLAVGAPGGTKSLSASTQQGNGHVNQPLGAPRTTTTTTAAPQAGTHGDGLRMANLDRTVSPTGARGDFSPQVNTPASNVVRQPPQPTVTERGLVGMAEGRATPRESSATGPTIHATPPTGPATVPHGTSLPPAMRPGGLPETSVLNSGNHLMPPTGRPGVTDYVPATTTSHTVAPHAPGRVFNETATSPAHPTSHQLRDHNVKFSEEIRGTTAGPVAPRHTPDFSKLIAGRVLDEAAIGATHPTPQQLRENHVKAFEGIGGTKADLPPDWSKHGPGRVLDETATTAAHPTSQQLRDQHANAYEGKQRATTADLPPDRSKHGPGRVLDETATTATHPTPQQLRAHHETFLDKVRGTTGADAPGPASTPTPGRQLLQTGPDGRADLVRVSAESRFTAEGRQPGGDARPTLEGPATGPDRSLSYVELRADGTMGPTTLRPGENVLHSQPLNGKPQEQLLSYSPDGRSWDVNSVTPAVRTAGAAQPRPTQMLRQNPDGTVDLLTFHKPPALASGPPVKPRPGEPSFHDLNGPGVRQGWQSRSFSPDEGFKVDQISRPQLTGQRVDGKELFFQREPTSMLVKDPVSHQWRPLGTTEGVATLPKGWGRAPDAPPVTVGKPADNPSFSRGGTGQGTPPDSAHYRWSMENGKVEPVKVRATSLEVVEIGTQTRSVSIGRQMATGGTGGGNGLDSLRMLPDGTLAPANPRAISDQIRLDPKSGAITVDGVRLTGGHSFGGGGGLSSHGPSHGSATQRPGEVDTAVAGHSDRSAVTRADSRLQNASAPPAPARADAGSTRIEHGAVPVRPDQAATRADAPGPATPRASTPTPGRQLLQTGPDGRADLVRVSAESRFPAEVRRPGGDARPTPEGPATGPDTSLSYIELRADGTMGPTTLRRGETVLDSQPLSGKIISYSPDGRSWDVNSATPAARPAGAAQPQPKRLTQMLRQNPDGTVDLLTFPTPPGLASGPSVKPRPGETSFHDLDGPGVQNGWHSRSIDHLRYWGEPVSRPPAGRRVDGGDLFFHREPRSLLVKDQASHQWRPLGTTEGVGPGAPPITVGKPAGNPSFGREGTPPDVHYRWSMENGRVEPVKVRATSLEVVEIGTQSRSVSIDRWMAGGGNGLDSLRMLPDGTFVPANPRTITPDQIRLDPESGAITMDGAGPTGGHSFGGGGGAPGSGGGGAPGSRGGGLSGRGPSHGSAGQADDGALTFVKPRSTAESSAAAMARDARTHADAAGERSDPGRTLGSGKPATRAGAGVGGPEEANAARIVTRGDDGTYVLGAPAEAPHNVLRKPQPDQTPAAEARAARIITRGHDGKYVLGNPAEAPHNVLRKPRPEQPPGTEVRTPDPAPGEHPAGTMPAALATPAVPAHEAAPGTPVDAVATPQVVAKPQAPPVVLDPTPPPAPTVPMRPPLAHEAPYVTAMPHGLSLTGQGNVVHLHTGMEPTRLVLRPGPDLTIVVDSSVTNLPDIRATLTRLHPSQPPVSTVEFVGARQPITPERAQQIADRLLAGLPGNPQISLLAAALTDAPTGAPAAKSYRFGASNGAPTNPPGEYDLPAAPAHDLAPRTPAGAVAKPEAPPVMVEPTPAPAVPMRAPLTHEAPYGTAMPYGLSMTMQDNVVHLHAGAGPTRLVLRPGPGLTVVVDASVTSLPAIRAALAELHPSQPPVSTVEFVGTRQPVTPERAQQIADRLLTGLPGSPQISLLASALTSAPTGAPAAESYRFGASNGAPTNPTGNSTLDQAARTQQWTARQDALRTDYAARIGTARRVEEFRPDLVGAFGNAVADAAARTERSPQPASLDRLPAEVADRFRTEFVAAGRHLFDRVWAPVIAAGTRSDDPAFQATEHEWQVRYEQLLTAVRGSTFSYLQAHRHEAAVQAAVLEARDAGRHVSETAVQAFYNDARTRLRTAFDESADPAGAQQWEALATTIEASIPGYFSEEALRRHANANTPAEGDDTTRLLEATPTAYESAARPVVDQARADIHEALNRPDPDIDAATQQWITHLLDGDIREATTYAQTWAERGGDTPAVVAAAVDGLRDILSDLVRSIPLLLLHHALLGEQVRAAGSAFDDLPTIDLPAPVSEALGQSFTLDWLTAYDELFRGDAVATTELHELPGTVQLATAGLEPLGRVPGLPGEQVQALPISDSELTGPAPDTRTAADEAADTLAATGHADIRDAFLTEADPVRRNTLLAGLLGESDAVLSALPALHTGLPVVTASDAAMARLLGYAHGTTRGEPLPTAEVHAAARDLHLETKLTLMDGLRLLAVANPARRPVLDTLGALILDC